MGRLTSEPCPSRPEAMRVIVADRATSPGEAVMASDLQLGDSVRFRVGMAPEALKGREAALGVVTALVPFGGPELWPVVQFDGFKTSVLQPGQLEVVGDTSPARDDPELAN